MKRIAMSVVSVLLMASVAPGFAQGQPTQLSTTGTVLVVPAYGEVKQANDEARATFQVEEQDRDQAAAASRVNLKMKQGSETIRQADGQAVLKTRGYYSYPVYAQDQPPGKNRLPSGWRVGQYLDVTTSNLAGLPKTVAAAQQKLALSALSFGLAPASARALEERRLEAAYRNLNERSAAIARAMGRSLGDAVLESVDFDASGAEIGQHDTAMKAMRVAPASAGMQVEAPSFEPGETVLQTRLVGKLRFR